MEILLETARLILRRFTPDDLDALCALHNDPDVMRYLNGGRPTPRAAIARETLPRFLRYDGPNGEFGAWAAIEKVTGTFLGWFSLRPRAGGAPGEAELGYRLHRAAWGKGYGTEGARALVHTGFADLGVRRIVAQTMTVNRASRRVMEKAGLRYVRTFYEEWPETIPGGEYGDVWYALDRADWERQQAGGENAAHRDHQE